MTLGSNSGLSIGTPSAAPSQGLLVQGAANFSSTLETTGLLSRRQASGNDGYIAYLTTAVQNTVMGFNNSGSTNSQGVLNNHSYFGNLNAFGLQFTTSGIVALTIATSGAATFNNNVSVAGTLNVTGTSTLTGRVFGIEIGVSKNGSDTVADGPWYRWTNADASRQILTQLNAGNGLTTWSFNGSSWSSIYTLTTSGAATFSSSVTATQFVANGNSTGGFEGLRIINASTGAAQIVLNNSAQSWFVNTRTDNHFSVFNATSSTTPFLITTGGNVLIGTTSDNSNRLRVNGSIWADGSIRSSNGTITTLLGFDAVTGPAGILNTTSGHQLWIQTGGITRIAVEAGGNVTIGSVAASERLVVYESAIDSKCYVHIQNNRSRNAGVLTRTTNGSFIAGTSINTDTFMYQIYDNVAGQNRLVVTSGGNVLINNATDVTGATLNVNGNIRTAAATNLTAANWKLGTARGGTVTTNATVRVEIDGALVDLVARYV
jgi:hypothetical protein